MKWKPRGSALEQAVLLVASILVANSVLGAERIAGPLQSPLSWRSVGDRSAALASARRSVGADKDAAPASIGLSVLTDKHPFGETFANRPVWIVTFPAVRVDRQGKRGRRGDSVKVQITAVIDPIDGRLLEAFTPAKDEWVPPVIAPRDPEQVASGDGWSVSPCKSELRSTVAQVLGVLWKTNSINPKKAGQIVVRPRTVACALPAVRVEGKSVPLRKPGPVWVVHVMGTVTRRLVGGPPPVPGAPTAKARPEYMSGLLSLVDDVSLKNFRGVFLP